MYYSFKNIKYHKIIQQLRPTYGNDCIVVSYTTQVIFSCFHNLNLYIYLNIFVISLSTRLRALSHFQMNLIEVLTKIRFTCFSREQHMIFFFKKSFLEFGFSLLPCVLKMLLLCCNLCAEDCAKDKCSSMHDATSCRPSLQQIRSNLKMLLLSFVQEN